MFNVELLNPNAFKTQVGDKSAVYAMSQLAAATCTQPSLMKAREIAPKIDVKKALFDTGHHTTIQHANHFLSFHLDNLPVSLVTFGLHMTHPFYSSSQCSGRYCTSLFETNDSSVLVKYIDTFIREFCPTAALYQSNIIKLTSWVFRGIDFYKRNLDAMAVLVEAAIKKERPFYPGNLKLQSRRIAQEQLRVVLSTIFPTRLVHTINFTSLLSMYASAWNNPLKNITRKMINQVPDIDFDNVISDILTSHADVESFVPKFDHNVQGIYVELLSEPTVDVNQFCRDSHVYEKLTRLYGSNKNNRVLDTLNFDPNTNPISYDESTVKVSVELPVAAYGQDQRHRMIKRSNPIVTGNFYVPPLVRQLPGAEDFCKEYMTDYLKLCNEMTNDDMIHFIPYGATVRYIKEADVRAYLHSANKRLCWSAELAISNMERKTLQQLEERAHNRMDIPCIIDAPCVDDKCHEGNRFCGRNLAERSDRELI